jgi:hypothetical protein
MRAIPTSQIRALLRPPVSVATILIVAGLTASSVLSMVVGWQLLVRSPLIALVPAHPTEMGMARCDWSRAPNSAPSTLLALTLIAVPVIFLMQGRLWTSRLLRRETGMRL